MNRSWLIGMLHEVISHAVGPVEVRRQLHALVDDIPHEAPVVLVTVPDEEKRV